MNSIPNTQTRISEATAAEQRAHEPSMEEILASIRRIIADDQMLPLTRSTAPDADVAPTREAAPAGREEHVARAPEPAPVVELPRAAPARREEIEFRASEPVAPPVVERPVRAAPPPRAAAPVETSPQRAPTREAPRQEAAPLLSPEMGASVSSAFNALATTMVLQNQGMIEEATRVVIERGKP